MSNYDDTGLSPALVENVIEINATMWLLVREVARISPQACATIFGVSVETAHIVSKLSKEQLSLVAAQGVCQFAPVSSRGMDLFLREVLKQKSPDRLRLARLMSTSANLFPPAPVHAQPQAAGGVERET